MKSKLIIFDLDGTLLNTIGDLAEACDHMLALRNLPQHTYEEYCSFVGNGIMRLVERALPEELRTPEYVAAARKDFVDYYIEHIDLKTVPYEGMVELLNDLQRDGARLAVASNKFQAGTDKLVSQFFGHLDFVKVLGQRDGYPIKPDAGVVIEIMQEIPGISKDEVLYCGDSDVDMKTGNNAGVNTLAVTWGFRTKEQLMPHTPWKMIDSPSEICDAVFTEK